ncbi:imelysin family protein [Flavicella sp.]|uniref:imelysin family protein n=1 Tax=Flavicella sp. TaxID=2957742 RepID=UPI0030162DBA
MKLQFNILMYTIIGLLSFSCSENDDDSNEESDYSTVKTNIVANYAEIVSANYNDAYDDAVSLQMAIATFTTSPTEETFIATKAAWRTSRESYGTTEAFRFASGPIDDSDGPEGLLNAWPLDEQYIDYVDGDSDAGIINDLITYPTITKILLEGLNEEGGEKNISIGYHAIEFLLWGQDLTDPSEKKAGQRAYTDYVVSSVPSKSNVTDIITNQERRAAYLNICAELLIDHLQLMVDEWKTGGAYRTTFLALDTDEAIQNMITGISVLSKSELAGERIYVAYDNQDQEDEHSCFSDNTHRDIRLNYYGVRNVYYGEYGSIFGTSIDYLISEIDSDLATEIRSFMRLATTDIENTAIPFDFAIKDETKRPAVLTSVNSLRTLGDKFVEVASALGLTVNIE